MIYYQEKIGSINGANFISVNRLDVARFRVEEGQIQIFDIWRDNYSPGAEVTFQLRVNGVAQFAEIDRPVLPADTEHVQVTGLDFDVVDGDVIGIDAIFGGGEERGGFRFPAYVRLGIDQAVGTTSLHALTDVDDTGKADLDVLTWDVMSGKWIPLPNDGSVSDDAYDESTWDGVTNIAPSQNAVRDIIETLGSSGAGGAGILSPIRSAPAAIDDEFDGTSLDAKWTMVSGPPAVISYDDTVRSAIYVRCNNSQDLGLKQAFAPGSADFYLTLCGMLDLVENFNNFVLQVEDATAANWLQIAWVFGTTKKIAYHKQVAGVATFDIGTFAVPSTANNAFTPDQVFLHIQRVSGTWGIWSSYNGYMWYPLTTSHSQSITVDKIFVNLGSGGGAAAQISGALHWIRSDWIRLS